MAIRRDDFPLPDVDDPLDRAVLRGRGARRADDHALRRVRRVRLVPAGRSARAARVRSRGPRCRARATLFSWAVVRRAFLPAFADRVPFVTALVALAEDPAVRLPDVPRRRRSRARSRADEPVRVTFRPLVVLDRARQVGDRPDVRAGRTRARDLRRVAGRRLLDGHRGRLLRQAADRPRRRRGVHVRRSTDPLFTYLRTSQRHIADLGCVVRNAPTS